MLTKKYILRERNLCPRPKIVSVKEIFKRKDFFAFSKLNELSAQKSSFKDNIEKFDKRAYICICLFLWLKWLMLETVNDSGK